MFVKSRFCPIHFTVTFAGPKNIVRIQRSSLNRGSTVQLTKIYKTRHSSDANLRFFKQANGMYGVFKVVIKLDWSYLCWYRLLQLVYRDGTQGIKQ